jgi:hypothetical protein
VVLATRTSVTVLLVAVNRFIALGIEHDLRDVAEVRAIGWSDGALDEAGEWQDVAAVVVDTTFLNEETAVPHLAGLFDCPLILVSVRSADLRLRDENGALCALDQPLSRFLAGVGRRP